VQISLDDDYSVPLTWCQCARGEALCHHIATLLLHAKENISQTDAPCQWIRRQQSKEMKTAADLFPRSERVCVLNRQPDEDDKGWFRDQLKSADRFCGFTWLLAPEPPAAMNSVTNVTDVMLMSGFVSATDQIDYVLNKLKTSPEDIAAVEELTRGQRGNPAWSACRKGRIRASNFGSVLRHLRAKRSRSTKSVMKTLLGEYDLTGMKAI